MNKLFTKITSLALGAAMMIGVGVIGSNRSNISKAYAGVGDKHDLFNVSSGWASTDSSHTTYSSSPWTSAGCQFAYAANNNKGWSYVRLGGKGITGVDAYIGTTSPTTYVTTQIDINVVAIYSASHINSVTLKVWSTFSNSTWSGSVDEINLSSAYKVGTVTATPSSGSNWASGVYFQLVVNYTNSTTKNRGTDVSSIIATEGSDAPVTSPDFELDKNSVSLVLGGESVTVTATPNEYVDAGASYSWTRTSGDDCVTLTGADTATVTIAPKGTAVSATCTLTIAVTDCTSKTVTVTVKKVSTKENPFNVAEAKAVVDAGVSGDMQNVYVHGIISQIDSYSSQYKSITYWISEDGSTENQFEVYSGKGLDNADFSSQNDLEVGYEVVVYGNIKLYSSTYEFDKNNYIVTLVRPNTYQVSTSTSGLTLSTNEIGTTGSITLTTDAKKKGTNVTINGTATSSIDGNVVTLTDVGSDISINATIVDATVNSISITGQTTKFAIGEDFIFDGTVEAVYDDWISPHTSETITSGYTVDSSAVKTDVEGNYTVIVSYNGVSTSYNVNVAEVFDKSKGEYHLVTDLSELSDGASIAITDSDCTFSMKDGFDSTKNNIQGITVEGDTNTNTISSTYKDSLLNVTLEKVADNTYYLKVISNDEDKYLYAASSSANQLKSASKETAGDNGKFLFSLNEGVFSIVAQGSNTRNSMRANPNNGSPIFACYNGTTGTAPVVYVFKTYTEEATAYAGKFLNANGSSFAGCSATISAWDTLKTAYGSLTAGAKALFTGEDHIPSETYSESTEISVKHAVCRYDDAVIKHSELRGDNEFMGRVNSGKLALSINLSPLALFGENNTGTVVIIIVSVIGVSALGGFFFLRKRKEI